MLVASGSSMVAAERLAQARGYLMTSEIPAPGPGSRRLRAAAPELARPPHRGRPTRADARYCKPYTTSWADDPIVRARDWWQPAIEDISMAVARLTFPPADTFTPPFGPPVTDTTAPQPLKLRGEHVFSFDVLGSTAASASAPSSRPCSRPWRARFRRSCLCSARPLRTGAEGMVRHLASPGSARRPGSHAGRAHRTGRRVRPAADGSASRRAADRGGVRCHGREPGRRNPRAHRHSRLDGGTGGPAVQRRAARRGRLGQLRRRPPTFRCSRVWVWRREPRSVRTAPGGDRLPLTARILACAAPDRPPVFRCDTDIAVPMAVVLADLRRHRGLLVACGAVALRRQHILR